MNKVVALLVAIVLLSLPVKGQFLPANAQSTFYFAHFADGGPVTSQWRTAIRITNPLGLSNFPVTGTLFFFDPQGNPLGVDFGSGASPSLPVSIPANGSIQLQSTGLNPNVRTGSIWATFDYPVSAVEEFQNWGNGAIVNAASVNGQAGSSVFQTFADKFTGMAVANVDSKAISCGGQFFDSSGKVVGRNTFSIGIGGQTSFTVGSVVSVGDGVVGSYELGCNVGVFAAVAIGGNSQGITSSMPPGGYSLPLDQFALARKAYSQLVKALNQLFPGFGQPQLKFYGDAVLNAWYDPATNTVNIEVGLLQLLADSPSETAWVLAHELGHAYQKFKGGNTFDANPELDADQLATVEMLVTGYDAYAAGGALGKLQMALGQTSLLAQAFDNLNDIHTSFSNRMGVVMSEIQQICGIQSLKEFCQTEHSIFHPQAPTPLHEIIHFVPE